MLRVLGCITDQHDLRLVVLAGLLCVFGCMTAMSMIWRIRLSTDRHRLFWLAAAAIVAGCAIWGTHFVAMLAFKPGLPVGYDPGLTVLSIVIAIVLCAAGFLLALQEGFAWIGGALTGAAISVMHYVGMAALQVPATAEWDARYVVASVLIGVMLSGATMAVKLDRGIVTHVAVTALLFTLAICGMHFTGMAAVTFIPDPAIAVPATLLNPGAMAIAVAAGAILIVGLGLTGVFVDNHLAWRVAAEAANLRAHVQELEATKALLEHSTKNLAVALSAADAASRAKTQFIAAMNHELRTPLNAVIGLTDIMLQQIFGPIGNSRYQEYVRDIHNSGRHLLSLVNRVLELSKLEAGEIKLDIQDVSIHDIIGDVLSGMSFQVKNAQIALTADIEPGLPMVRVDQQRIHQVLINLVENAVKFTPKGGSVCLTARRAGNELALAVTDTGIGIAPKDIADALDRFGQVDNSLARRYEGAGLGLPLAKLLVEVHGGRLAIASELHVGTTVTVFLPAERLVAEQQAA